MICSLDDIKNKEVIDIITGERLGYIDDVEMNIETSGIVALIILGREKFWGLLGKEEDVIIPCKEIEVIGNDVLLIKRTEESKLAGMSKNRRFGIKSLFK